MAKKYEPTDNDKALFRDAVKGTRPIKSDTLHPEPKKMTGRRRTLSSPLSENITRESYSDPHNASSIEGNEAISFHRGGLQSKFLHQLRRGEIDMQAVLDLHNHTRDQARQELHQFITQSFQRGLKFVRVIHGKGYRSTDGTAVLKNHVNHWLQQHSEVLAFCSAQPRDGGTGALYIVLKSSR